MINIKDEDYFRHLGKYCHNCILEEAVSCLLSWECCEGSGAATTDYFSLNIKLLIATQLIEYLFRIKNVSN